MPVSSSKSDLKRFLDAKTKPSRLIGDIERHLMARPVGDRSTTVLHPSEIIKRDFCRRSAYFLLSGHTKIAEKPNLRLQSIFDEGHAIHAKWQRWFQEMGVLYGRFTCTACKFSLFDLGPTTCPNCGNDTMEYNEVTLVDNDLRIAGHTDGWIKGIGDDTLIEIKSIGPGTKFSIKRDFELVRHIFDNAKLIVDAVEAGLVPDCNNNPGGTCKQCAPYKED